MFEEEEVQQQHPEEEVETEEDQELPQHQEEEEEEGAEAEQEAVTEKLTKAETSNVWMILLIRELNLIQINHLQILIINYYVKHATDI